MSFRKMLSRTMLGRKAFWVLAGAYGFGRLLQSLTGSPWPFWILTLGGVVVFVIDVFRFLREMAVRDLQRCGYPRQSDPPQPASSSTTKTVDAHEHD
ncbi:MAG TPA: hypothetical protein VNZ27_08135 [Rhodanobacter sp.]|jgi:putative solute:sodium symporter small subunit|nr:hypothetical protein [Rhodanobacter sp.]